MRTILRAVGVTLLALFVSGMAGGKPPATGSGPPQSSPPPLIDRELFFGDPEISSESLSPDGRYMAFLKPWKNTRNIYVKAVDEPSVPPIC